MILLLFQSYESNITGNGILTKANVMNRWQKKVKMIKKGIENKNEVETLIFDLNN